ncbi:multicopper oxidase [Polyporus arcularius HHB13444]|uniref:laccase n=1 Tax=Polyporus arcularius HHB13444 TaxID=1314778 RepID=A0A5C3NWE5_9APHY|nr:multicopper oxidase [Polyporus arcularius HHB13444]
MAGSSATHESKGDARDLAHDHAPTIANGTKSASGRPRKPLIILAVIVAALVVLGLALGLGLGLGLKHKRSSDAASANPTATTTNLQNVATPKSADAFLSADIVDEPPTTRTYNFTVEERTGSPDGVQKRMLVVNGQYPGPTIEANGGDRIVVNVTNKVSNSTSIHWHGLYQRGTNFYDGSMAITQCGIPTGESMVYNFTFDGFVGSTWWHAHAGTQYTDGITGALIIHAKNESVPTYDGDIVLQLADLYHGFSPDLLNLYHTPGGIDGTPGNEPVPDGGTINGVGQYGSSNTSFFNVTLEANKTYRLRLVNTGSFVAMEFSVDNHTLEVIEADGTAVEPFAVSSLSIAVAQRYSVLLRTNQTTGAYWFRSALDQDAFTYDNPGVQTEIRGIVRYGVDNATIPDVALLDSPPSLPDGAPGDLDTTDLVPVDGGPAPDSTFSVYLTISMQYASGPDYLSRFLSFINSTSWEPLLKTSSLFAHLGNHTVDGSATLADSQLVTTVNEVHVVDMIIDNLDDGDHPFHLHGHKFWIMQSGVGRYQGESVDNEHPMQRDTLVIPAYTHVVLRFVGDNPGFWAFHCHIQWHMAAGLLFQLNMLPSESSKFNIPQYMVDQCQRA